MKLRLVWLIALLLVIGTALAAAAQDAPPGELPEDNACYAGGSLAGKCDWPSDAEDEWAWNCGWYIARVETGVFDAGQIPAWCGYFVEIGFSGTCYDSGYPDISDLMLTGPLNSVDNAAPFNSSDGSCSGPMLDDRATIVTIEMEKDEEINQLRAEERCMSVTGALRSSAYHAGSEMGYDVPNNWWFCAGDK